MFTSYNVSVAVSNVNGSGLFSDPITNVSCDGGETERETPASSINFEATYTMYM